MKMDQTLVIKNILMLEDGVSRTISADIGEDNIWFKVSREIPMQLCVEPFIAVALLEAMCTGKNIEVVDDIKVSKQFFEGLIEIQTIFRCWNQDLRIIDVLAEIKSEQECSGEIASFFSAGVDSSHTFCRHLEGITHLVIMDVFDDACSSEEWQSYIQKQRVFAQSFDKVLLSIQSNVRQYSEDKSISWEFMHGPVLCSVGNLFGFDKVYVPSSSTYDELHPSGTHPLTDPMWSTESMKVIHDGCGDRRWEKVRYLMGYQTILDNLQVCWRSKVTNCGECPKCIRTMLSLHLLGGFSKPLPKYNDIRQLKMLKAIDRVGEIYLEQSKEMALLAGDQKIHRKLYFYHRQYQLQLFLEYTDKLLLGGLLRRLYRATKKPKWRNARVSLGAKY